jgi:uncharacterized protein YqcC (DUF446 family)
LLGQNLPLVWVEVKAVECSPTHLECDMRTEIAEVLIDIEAQLRQLGMWDKIPPSTQALASTEPFCVDTLTLPQWLQFIFIPALYQMLEAEQALPDRCGIAPMAEEFFRGSDMAIDALVASLVKVDELLSVEGSPEDN